jgi:hypothetical protein
MLANPHLRRRPVTPGLAVRIDGNPVRVGRLQVVVSGVRVCPHQDGHAELPAAGDKFPKNIAAAEPRATVVKRNLGGIICNAAPAAEAHAFGACALEVGLILQAFGREW